MYLCEARRLFNGFIKQMQLILNCLSKLKNTFYIGKGIYNLCEEDMKTRLAILSVFGLTEMKTS